MSSYVPPHKRQSSSSSSSTPPSPPPTLPSLQPSYKNYPHGTKKDKQKGNSKIIFAKNAVSKWFPVGLADNSQLPNKTHLQTFPLQLSAQSSQEKPLILVLNHHKHIKEDNEGAGQLPWDYIAENVQAELTSSFERVKIEKIENETEDVRPTLVARFGEILFQGGQRDSVENTVTNLAQLKKSFNTNVLSSYIDYIINEVVSKLGLHFEQEKELYHVKISDNKKPDSTLSCKCKVLRDPERLELFKDDEITNIKSLIACATLDSEVKGGLRWPFGKDSSGDRYTVCGVWHTTAKTYRSSSIRLKVRQADRFDFRSSKGENASEVNLKMRGIISLLQETIPQNELVSQMLKDNLRLIWEYCLDRRACASALT